MSRHLRRGALGTLGTLTVAAALMCAAERGLAQSVHTPTEYELKRRLSQEPPDDDGRRLQANAVQRVQTGSQQALSWGERKLVELREWITPARFALALGLLAIVLTWNKNKHKVQWGVIAGIGWLLVIVGGAAIYFGWAYFNR